uniref:Uncharacterized protein n=1 Tax=Arundo donax TaxID=35708 RepID=A0A0A9EP01_ARUDO
MYGTNTITLPTFPWTGTSVLRVARELDWKLEYNSSACKNLHVATAKFCHTLKHRRNQMQSGTPFPTKMKIPQQRILSRGRLSLIL